MKARRCFCLMALTSTLALTAACDKKSDPPLTEEKSEEKVEAKSEPDLKLPELETPPADAAAADADAPAVIEPKVETKILSQGSGTKKPLRYAFKNGKTKRFSIQQVTRSSGKMNGQEMPGSGQPFQMTLVGESSHEGPDAAGITTRRTKFSSIVPQSPGAPPQMLQQLRDSFKSAIGVTLSEKLNNKGELKGISADIPLNAPPQLQQLLNGLRSGIASALIPLPEEALGKGAKWRSTITVDNGGRSFEQASTFTILSLDGDQVKLKVELSMKAPAQKVVPPGAPPGTEIELIKYEGSGEGTITLNLANLDCDLEMKQASTEITKVTSPQAPEPMQSESTTEVSLKLTQKD